MKTLLVPLAILLVLAGATVIAAQLLGFTSGIPALLSGYIVAGVLAIASRDYRRTESRRVRRAPPPAAARIKPKGRLASAPTWSAQTHSG